MSDLQNPTRRYKCVYCGITSKTFHEGAADCQAACRELTDFLSELKRLLVPEEIGVALYTKLSDFIVSTDTDKSNANGKCEHKCYCTRDS